MSSADVRSGKLLFLKNYITEEDLSSQIDGIITEFTLLNNFVGGTIRLFLNGLRQQKGIGKDYTEVTPNKIEFSVAPDIDDIILIDYVKK